MTLDIRIDTLGTAQTMLVRNLMLQVQPGSVHTVMGASGSGKSSLLAAAAGTLAPGLHFDGSIMLNGRDVTHLPTELRRIGILFQDDLLFAHMTVAENLLFAVPPGAARATRTHAAMQGLRDLELEHVAHANPATLSGGQRSRVALMRALLAQPLALLLDEPFSRLDAALRARMRMLVFAQVRQRAIPALLVTHDAADIADPACMTQLV